jgi:hypothetical protein
MGMVETSRKPSFQEALAVWAKIGVLSFGGPAGQIALMHRVLVEEQRWIGEERFLHAQFLHAAAGTGGHAARQLCRLASAPHGGRSCRRTTVRAARRLHRAGTQHRLCLYGQVPLVEIALHRHQGRSADDRGRGAYQGRAPRTARPSPRPPRPSLPSSSLLRLSRSSSPGLRCSASCCRAFHLLPRPRRSRNLPFCCRARCKRQRFGSRFGSCRSFCSRRFSAALT